MMAWVGRVSLARGNSINKDNWAMFMLVIYTKVGAVNFELKNVAQLLSQINKYFLF